MGWWIIGTAHLFAAPARLNESTREKSPDLRGLKDVDGLAVKCTLSGCQCACHQPGMTVAHLVACCERPPHPVSKEDRAGTYCEDYERDGCSVSFCPTGCWQAIDV